MNSKKILFIHNSITWYRIPFFIQLNKICNVKFIFSKVNKSNKSYEGLKTSYDHMKQLDYVITKNKFGISWGSILETLRGDYDIVLVTVLDSKDQIFESFICAIIAKIRKKKVAYFWEKWLVPDEYLNFKQKFKNRIYLNLLRIHKCLVDTYIVPGKKAFEFFLSAHIPKEKINVAPDASEIDSCDQKIIDIREKHGIEKNKKIILYFGRILEYKGLDILIKSFEKISKYNSEVCLLVCGDGNFGEKCKKYVKDKGIENVIFVGLIQPYERVNYYSQCNIFVLPNKYYENTLEVWGLSINEAMGFGKPVVSTTANGAAYDLIKNGYNGFVVEQNDVNQLTEALNIILEDKELEKNMGRNSLNIIKNFSYKNMAKGFKEAFELPYYEKK